MKNNLTPWRPKPRVLEQVKQYFLGFAHNGREIYARRKKIAERLNMPVRTLDRYLHYLAETEWMETTERRPRIALTHAHRLSAHRRSRWECAGTFKAA